MFLFFVARRGKKGFQKGKGEGGRHEPLSPFEAKVSTKGTLKVPYDNYDFEAVYSEDIPEDEELIANDINCLQRTDSTKAGEMIEIQSFPSFLNRKDYSRAKKCRPSGIEQQNLNEKNARKKIIRLTNANFTTDDIWGTFGWDNEQQPPTVDDARRETVNFIGRINYRRKKRGQLPLKYLYVIESVPGNPDEGEPEIKYHIHIIMGGDIDRDETEKLWHGGEYPQTRRLVIKDFGGLTGLSTYIAKHPDGKKRWGQSQGLKPWTRKPSKSYSKFKKSEIQKLMRDRNLLKEVFEKKYPGYAYSEDYPCEIKYNEQIGGYYLYCRMYKKHFGGKLDKQPPKRKRVKS